MTNSRPSSNSFGRWLPVDLADKTITDVQDFPEVGMTIRTSDRYWVRDDDGRIYAAAWSEGNNGRDYWWDYDGESPVDPVEFMPHPLDPRFALTSEGKADATQSSQTHVVLPELTGDQLQELRKLLDNASPGIIVAGPQPQAHVTWTEEGIERAARYIEKQRDDYVQEFGKYDPSTGVTEFSTAGEEHLSTLEELINGIRSLHETPTPPGNQIRTAECDGKDAVPVTGQLPVGTASPQQHADGGLTGLKPIPIEAAKRIAKEYGYDQVLIYARRCHDTPEPHGEHMTTYGRNREHCDVAARMGDVLKKFMGWEI